MNTKYPLAKYEEMYKTFDAGHNEVHMESVRNFAVKLAKKHCPEKVEIAYVAATLHDIGLSVAREGHETEGYNIILKDELLKEIYGEELYQDILEAVKEHRASSGNPQGVLAKIVSDADKVSDTAESALKRAYKYGVQNYPELNHEQQLERSGSHLTEKFGPNGTGTRVYFEESRLRLKETYDPIINAYQKRDFKRLDEIMEGSI